jgi:hypothetical protein
MLELIEQPAERARLADAARRVADQKYSRASYLKRTADAYRRLGAPDAPAAPVAPAAPDAPAAPVAPDAPAKTEFARQ